MVNLLQFIGEGTKVNVNQQVWVQLLWFMHLGDGVFTRLEPQHMVFEGKISSPVYSGPFNMAIDFIDDHKCQSRLNDGIVEGMYRVSNNKLILTGNGGPKGKITVFRSGQKTYINVEGAIKASIYIIKGNHK